MSDEKKTAITDDGRELEIVGRKEAKKFGHKFYFTGKPCKNGHTLQRYTNNSVCVRCSRNYKVKHYTENKEQYKRNSKKYRQKHREDYNRWSRESRIRNLEHCREIERKYYKNNKEKLREKSRKWAQDNKELVRNIKNKYRQENRQTLRDRQRTREKTDMGYYLMRLLRSRVRTAIRNQSGIKAKKTSLLLGCSMDEFRSYIESKFSRGMSWEALFMGEIHLDHVRPCASFDLTVPEQQKECFHYTNYQPLWARDNLRKSSIWNGKKYVKGKPIS